MDLIVLCNTLVRGSSIPHRVGGCGGEWESRWTFLGGQDPVAGFSYRPCSIEAFWSCGVEALHWCCFLLVLVGTQATNIIQSFSTITFHLLQEYSINSQLNMVVYSFYIFDRHGPYRAPCSSSISPHR